MSIYTSLQEQNWFDLRDKLKQLQSTLEIMEAKNPEISFKICMNVIEDNIKKMEER